LEANETLGQARAWAGLRRHGYCSGGDAEGKEIPMELVFGIAGLALFAYWVCRMIRMWRE